MILTYSGRSKPSALEIAAASEGNITVSRTHTGSANWGRATADTELNPDISNSTNKRVMRQLFKEHDVPMPKLIDVDNHNWTYPIVGRPDQHSKGRGYWLCDTSQAIERAIRGTRRKKAATHFMEFVDAPHELRIHIFLGKSIRISEKKFDDNREYTTIKPTVEVKLARRAAKKAVKALGLDFGAVDILVKDDGTPYVLEVNAAPGLGGTMPALYAKTFKQWEDGELI